MYSSYIILSLFLFVLLFFLFLPPFDSKSFSIYKHNVDSTQFFYRVNALEKTT